MKSQVENLKTVNEVSRKMLEAAYDNVMAEMEIRPEMDTTDAMSIFIVAYAKASAVCLVGLSKTCNTPFEIIAELFFSNVAPEMVEAGEVMGHKVSMTEIVTAMTEAVAPNSGPRQ